MTHEIDISINADFFLNPYVEYRRLLEHSSVVWSEKRKSWLVLGYEEIKTGLLLDSLSSSRSTSTVSGTKLGYDSERLERLENFYTNWLMYMDGEQHASLRRSVVKALNSAVTDETYSYARNLAQDLIRDLPKDGTVNILKDLILPYCGNIMLKVLGIVGLSYKDLLELTENIVGFLGMSSFDSSIVDKVVDDISRLEKVIDQKAIEENGFVSKFLSEVSNRELLRINMTNFIKPSEKRYLKLILA